ncbi:MAG: 50S ribosome-binding GTPase [Spirochaetes bacterium]|nr:50S ribosome-binding GTPase [Spirochaetota bacterium]
MTGTPRSERIHIALFGCCNAGKSSLLNALTEKNLAIVSDQPGTTTDPVAKSMELGELGAVCLTDTAGLDDNSELGSARSGKALAVLNTCDVAILVTPGNRPPQPAELAALERIAAASKPLLIARTFGELPADTDKSAWLDTLLATGAKQTGDTAKKATEVEWGTSRSATVQVSAVKSDQAADPGFSILHILAVCPVDSPSGKGIAELRGCLSDIRAAIARQKQEGLIPDKLRLGEPGPLDGLVNPGDLVVLVTPIDSAAPRGRMILPEAQTLRDALDKDCITITVRETQLAAALAALAKPPALVVTDSQAFAEVAALLPPEQRLTSFSILFARKKGEINSYTKGMQRLDQLADATTTAEDRPTEPLRLLAIEACAHNRTHEDIATVKIPALLEQRLQRPVVLTLSRCIEDELPAGQFDLVLLCGGCMATANTVAQLHGRLTAASLPFVNFGLALAWLNGLYPRAVRGLGTQQ